MVVVHWVESIAILNIQIEKTTKHLAKLGSAASAPMSFARTYASLIFIVSSFKKVILYNLKQK